MLQNIVLLMLFDVLQSRKRIQLLVKNVMLFDHFGGHFRKRIQKVNKLSRFYKGFRNAFLHFEKREIRQVL